MNKKIIAVFVVILFLFLTCVVLWGFESKKQFTQEEIQMLVQNSYLDILVNIENYPQEDINNEVVLETAMRIARELGLVEFDESKSNFEYVQSSYIEKIVFELTGKQLTEPIIVDYFKYYYPYNAEFNIYEIIPMGTSWIHLENINNIENKGNIYYIDCSAKLKDGDYYIYVESVKLELEYIKENDFVKYQINNIESTTRYYLPEKAQNVAYNKLIDICIVEDNAKQHILNTQSEEIVNLIDVEEIYSQYVYADTKKEVIFDGNSLNIQDKLCVEVSFYAKEEGFVKVYVDAYTGEIYGIDMVK